MTTDIKSVDQDGKTVSNTPFSIRENVALRNENNKQTKKPRIIRDIKINYPTNGLYGLL